MNRPIREWKNKKIWVIGASTGIGKALCENLISVGANLYVSARSEILLNELALKTPLQVISLPLDVLNIEEIKTQFQKVSELDMVIYLAADYSPISITNFEYEKVSRIVDVNLKGATNILSVVLPYFIQRRCGHISLVASIAGYIGLPHSSVYGATKAALINLAESLYQESKEYNLDISVVNPGFVRTELTQKNTFSMPFIMAPRQAAQNIVRGLELGKFCIVFPTLFSLFFRSIRILPYPLHLYLVRKLIKNE